MGTDYSGIVRPSSPLPVRAASLACEAVKLFREGRLSAAAEKFEAALLIELENAELMVNLAIVRKELGAHFESLRWLDKALQIDKENAHAHFCRANLYFSIGSAELACQDYQTVLNIDPAHYEALNNWALLMVGQGEYERALVKLNMALDIFPAYEEALFNRGNTRYKLGDVDGALADYESAILINPRRLEAYNNLGHLLRESRQCEAALGYFDRLLRIDPLSSTGLNNKAGTLMQLGRFSEALPLVLSVIDRDPGNADAWDNLGNSKLHFELDPLGALECYDRAINLCPDNARIRWNRSLVDLLLGNEERGWRDFEFRWKVDSFRKRYERVLFSSEWTGDISDLAGKRLLVYSEQGFGDSIQFFRYLKALTNHNVSVYFLTRAPLVPLFQGAGLPIKFVRDWPCEGTYDLHSSLMALSGRFLFSGLRPDNAKYLTSDLLKQGAFRQILGPKRRPRIGVAWRGNSDHPNDLNRSISIETFLSAIPSSFELHSIQREYRSGELEKAVARGVADHSKYLLDFSDTAALIDVMDIIITVDTSVAHLAGALGKPCWVLLPRIPDWRWGLDSETTPLYPSLRLFRQLTKGDWSHPSKAMRGALEEWGRTMHPTNHRGSLEQPLPNTQVQSLGSVESLVKAKQFEAAKLICEGVLAQDSKNFEALCLLGSIFLEGFQDFDRAQAAFDQAFAINPRHPSLLNNIGLVKQALGKRLEALECFSQVLKSKPDHPEALFNRGRLLVLMAQDNVHQIDAGISDFNSVLRISPNFSNAYVERAIAHRKKGELAFAMADIASGLACAPMNAALRNVMGICLTDLGRDEEAIQWFDEAIEINPLQLDARSNRAGSLCRLGHLQASIDGFREALDISPGEGEISFSLSLSLLLAGQYDEGWKFYQSRERIGDLKFIRETIAPSFNSESELRGKRVLLTSEQGLGDVIQFARYTRLLRERGAHVTLEAPQPLIPVLETVPWIDSLKSGKDTGSDYDYQCPLLSIPYALRLGSEGIRPTGPYVHVQDRYRKFWLKQLPTKSRPRIGLVWSGNPGHKNDKNRTMNLATLLEALPIEYEYVSLQKVVRDLDSELLAKTPILRLDALISDFGDTAAICESCDLIVTVDTSVAHLSGALGKPTILLLPYAPDWRWGLNKDESDWYPSFQLVRQVQAGDWGGTMAALHDQIRMQFEWAANTANAVG